jgi:hypothetical protein
VSGSVLLPVLVLLVLVAGFDVLCLVDLARAEAVRYLPRVGWAIVIVLISPWAGIVYLAVGKAY